MTTTLCPRPTNDWPLVKPRQKVLIIVNHDVRDARVLAVIGKVALVEYEMPCRTTALAFATAEPDAVLIKHDGVDTITERTYEVDRILARPCTYQSLLKRWLVAVINQSGSWRGRSFNGKMPSPQAVLKERLHANQNKGHTWQEQYRRAVASAGPRPKERTA